MPKDLYTKEEILALCAVQGWDIHEVGSVSGNVFWVEIRQRHGLIWLGNSWSKDINTAYTQAYEEALINYNRENQ
jgi:hypothetical protein